MPNHIEIQGGRPTGKPENWNEAEHGPCGTLSVLYAHDERGFSTMTSAWRLTPAEIQAMQHDGVMFLQILGQKHPVLAMWVQDSAGEAVALDAEPKPAVSARDSLVDPAYEPGRDNGQMLTDALAGALTDLEHQAEGEFELGEIDDAGRVWVRGTVDLKALLEAALERAAPAAPSGQLIEIPLLTLGAVAAEGQARSVLEAISGRACRCCGCTETNACTSDQGPCSWSQPDLCSHCDIGLPITGIEHPAFSHPNAAVCPASACRFPNHIPLETLREDWQEHECRSCQMPLQVRAITVGPELPNEGGYSIQCRKAPIE